LQPPGQLCRMAMGVISWSQAPPPPPQTFDPLRLVNDYTLEWAAYSLLTYMLVGESQIRDAQQEGQTFLLFRFRAVGDGGDLRFWYCTPEPVPFPLLRPDPKNRLPPLASRAFTLTAAGFAGFVFPIASPGPDAETFIRQTLSQTGQLTFSVFYNG